MNLIGDKKFFCLRPAVSSLRQPDLVFAQRFSVGRAGILLVWRSPRDVALDDDQGRPVACVFKNLKSLVQHFKIVGIADTGYIPAQADEFRRYILAEGQIRVTLDCDFVAVINPAEVGELPVARERSSFSRDAFHHAPVTAERICVKVKHLKTRTVKSLCRPARSKSHTHTCSKALSQRSSRCLNAAGPTIFGMAGTLRV